MQTDGTVLQYIGTNQMVWGSPQRQSADCPAVWHCRAAEHSGFYGGRTAFLYAPSSDNGYLQSTSNLLNTGNLN